MKVQLCLPILPFTPNNDPSYKALHSEAGVKLPKISFLAKVVVVALFQQFWNLCCDFAILLGLHWASNNHASNVHFFHSGNTPHLWYLLHQVPSVQGLYSENCYIVKYFSHRLGHHEIIDFTTTIDHVAKHGCVTMIGAMKFVPYAATSASNQRAQQVALHHQASQDAASSPIAECAVWGP